MFKLLNENSCEKVGEWKYLIYEVDHLGGFVCIRNNGIRNEILSNIKFDSHYGAKPYYSRFDIFHKKNYELYLLNLAQIEYLDYLPSHNWEVVPV